MKIHFWEKLGTCKSVFFLLNVVAQKGQNDHPGVNVESHEKTNIALWCVSLMAQVICE